MYMYMNVVFCYCLLLSGNKWLQQQIPACRPVFSATHVAIAFIIIGIVFLAMGIAFTVVSMRVSHCVIVN